MADNEITLRRIDPGKSVRANFSVMATVDGKVVFDSAFSRAETVPEQLDRAAQEWQAAMAEEGE